MRCGRRTIRQSWTISSSLWRPYSRKSKSMMAATHSSSRTQLRMDCEEIVWFSVVILPNSVVLGNVHFLSHSKCMSFPSKMFISTFSIYKRLSILAGGKMFKGQARKGGTKREMSKNLGKSPKCMSWLLFQWKPKMKFRFGFSAQNSIIDHIFVKNNEKGRQGGASEIFSKTEW